MTAAPLPQVAQPAIQGGKHVARQIVAQLHGRPTQPFRYHDKGQMATIGRHDAVTELANGWRLSGPIGWLAWLGLHLLYLMGFRNRVDVFVDWAWNYLTFDRSSRILREAERRDVEVGTARVSGRRRRPDWCDARHALTTRAESSARSAPTPLRPPGAVQCLLLPPSVPAT